MSEKFPLPTKIESSHNDVIDAVINNYYALKEFAPYNFLLNFILEINTFGFSYNPDKIDEFARLYAYEEATLTTVLARYADSLYHEIGRIDTVRFFEELRISRRRFNGNI